MNEEWHITPVGGKVFTDLGFDAKEAARLKAGSDRIIAEKQAIKEQLMFAVNFSHIMKC